MLSLNNRRETPQEQRERLRQKELKNNPTGNIHDALNRASGGGNLTDLTGGMGWKYLGMLITYINSWICTLQTIFLDLITSSTVT